MPTAIASRQDWPKAMSAICRASSSGARLKLSHCCGLCEERPSIWLSAMIGIARFGVERSDIGFSERADNHVRATVYGALIGRGRIIVLIRVDRHDSGPAVGISKQSVQLAHGAADNRSLGAC